MLTCSFSEIYETLRSISKSQASFAKKLDIEKLEKQSLQQHAKLVDTVCGDITESDKHWSHRFEQLREEMNTKLCHLESQILITTADKTQRDGITKKIKNLEKMIDVYHMCTL